MIDTTPASAQRDEINQRLARGDPASAGCRASAYAAFRKANNQ